MADADSTTATVLIFKPRIGGKRPRRGARARYYYPREALEQSYFTTNSYGHKFPSRLGLSMLTDEMFESQIALLLSQLTNEGFDVSGPQAEYRAMREVLQETNARALQLEDWTMKWRLQCTTPAREYAEQTDKD